jgi:tetratricopeptide (TPR) repeat protein
MKRSPARVVVYAMCGWSCGVASSTVAGAADTPADAVYPIAKWLVDLGRDYPLSPQASLTDADAELTLAFMRAASRVDAELAEAWLWQHNMLWALGRETEATEALGRYVALDRGAWTARLRWIEQRTAAMQTVEDRVAFWREELARPDLPGEIASDLHRRMAEYHFNRGADAEARRAVDAALAAFPENVAALRLRFAIDGRADEPTARLEIALAVMRLSPGRPALAWDVALILAEQGMHAEALAWYGHAMELLHRAHPDMEPPVDFVLDRATTHVNAGQLDAATALVDDVLKRERSNVMALRLKARIERLAGRADEARRLLAKVRQIYDATLRGDAARRDPELAAEVAWFHCIEDPDIDRAYELARIAMRPVTPPPLARRAFAYAAASKGETQAAINAGAPTAGEDPWCALALAIAHAGAGDKAKAVALLTPVAERHRAGLLFEQVSARLASWGAPVPASPYRKGMEQALAAFDPALLRFTADPAAYVSLEVTPLPPDGKAFVAGQPVWCRFVLKNIGSFPVTLGESLMVTPMVVLNLRSTGDRQRDYGGLVRVSLGRRQFLRPGESIEVKQTLGIGPLRATLVGTAQQTQTVTGSAILSPELAPDGSGFQPGPGGVSKNGITFTRAALHPGAAGSLGLSATLVAAQSGEVEARVEATDRLMMWFAEHQGLAAGRLAYKAEPIDEAAVRAAVIARFGDPAWEVRAHLAEALRWILLDNEMARHASALLRDPHWAVRMLAVRMFADQQGAAFDKVAAYYADHDSDELVRTVARALRTRWAAATQPATTEPGE